MPKPSRLGESFCKCDISDWDSFFPREICGKCEIAEQCGKNQYCAALLTIAATAFIFSVGPLESKQKFFKYLKVATEAPVEISAVLIS